MDEGPRISRPAAIALLRQKLVGMTDEDHCMCSAAARAGVFCRGFSRVSDAEFRRRFDWIARTRPRASRAELEEAVNLYHLGRQEVTGATLCCDVETRERTGCGGWNRFDNATIQAFVLELTGLRVQVG